MGGGAELGNATRSAGLRPANRCRYFRIGTRSEMRNSTEALLNLQILTEFDRMGADAS